MTAVGLTRLQAHVARRPPPGRAADEPLVDPPLPFARLIDFQQGFGGLPSHPTARAANQATVLQLQRTMGNRAVQRLSRRPSGPTIQRCGATPCGCSAAERTEHELEQMPGVTAAASSIAAMPVARQAALLERLAEPEKGPVLARRLLDPGSGPVLLQRLTKPGPFLALPIQRDWWGDDEETASEGSGSSVLDWAGEQAGGAMDWASEKGGGALDWAAETGGGALDWAGEQAGGAVDWAAEQGGAAVNWVSEQTGVGAGWGGGQAGNDFNPVINDRDFGDVDEWPENRPKEQDFGDVDEWPEAKHQACVTKADDQLNTCTDTASTYCSGIQTGLGIAGGLIGSAAGGPLGGAAGAGLALLLTAGCREKAAKVCRNQNAVSKAKCAEEAFPNP